MSDFNSCKENDLVQNIQKLHTTPMGVERIAKNLLLTTKTEKDVVAFCKSQILDKNAIIERCGKNWYVKVNDNIFTVNAYSFTIITAHKV